MVTPLSDAGLTSYHGNARTPHYDRAAVTAGIAHIGVGNFHRSHQAAYVDALLGAGAATEWGILGLGLLPADRHTSDALDAQNRLYTLVTKATGEPATARVIGSIVDYLYVPDAPRAAVERLAEPAIRIVTLTVTEGGYNLSPSTGSFDPGDPIILAESRDEGVMRTHFRLLRDALRLRRDRGIAPFTVASCDNIRTNGDVARETLVQFTALTDPDLAEWIEQSVPFPNSMVDRITPMTKPGDRERVREEFGLDDLRPVFAEAFVQWVVEDRFPTGRPELERVGVQFVDDVLPFELMKLRLLNASHQVIAYLSFLRGHEVVHSAMADPAIAAVVARFQLDEAEPTLPPVPGVDLAQYRATLLQRFANPAIEDTVARLCAQSSTSIPNFVLPIIRDQLARGGRIDVAAAVVAAWATYAAEGDGWQIEDRRRDSLVVSASNPDRSVFLDDRSIFGSLSDDATFRRAFLAARRIIDEQGIGALIDRLAAGESYVREERVRAAVVTPGHGVAVETIRLPEPAVGEAVVRSSLVGICGSDTHALGGAHPFLTTPYVPGHEAVGVIERVGSDADTSRIGTRVVLKPNLPCGRCVNCEAGRTNACVQLEWIGCDPSGAHPGAMADRFSAPLSNLYPIPDHVADEAAVLVECLATPLHAVSLLPDATDASVLILGAGTIGLLAYVAARASGAKSVALTDLDPGKRARALRLGADAAVDPRDHDADEQIRRALGGPADGVLDCVANRSSIADAVRLVVRGGTVVVVGVPAGEVSVPLHVIQDHEIDLQGCASFTEVDLRESIRLVSAGALPFAELIDGSFELGEVAAAFERAAHGTSGKTVLRFT